METATAKNKALSQAGAHVPSTFDELGETIRQGSIVDWAKFYFHGFAFYIIIQNEMYIIDFRKVYTDLVEKGVIVPKVEVPPPTVPMDYNWARELGLIRKPASFMTSICDERGQELLYAGVPITTVFEEGLGIGGVLGLLWFQKRYCVCLFACETAS